jgi:hypothetical protein
MVALTWADGAARMPWNSSRPTYIPGESGLGYVAPMDRDNQPPGAASYSLELSEQEVLRYRLMAARPAPTRSPSPTA